MKVPKVLTPVDIFRPYHMGLIRRRNPARKPVKRRPDTTDMPFVSLILGRFGGEWWRPCPPGYRRGPGGSAGNEAGAVSGTPRAGRAGQ